MGKVSSMQGPNETWVTQEEMLKAWGVLGAFSLAIVPSFLEKVKDEPSWSLRISTVLLRLNFYISCTL